MTASTIGRAALALAGAGALAALGGGIAHADEVVPGTGTDTVTEATEDGSAAAGQGGSEEQASGSDSDEAPADEAPAADTAGSTVPVFLLRDVPAVPLPGSLITPVDALAPVYGLLGGLS